MREDVEVICPACHESIPLTVNPAKGSKTWEEECCVCDTPMNVRLIVDEDDEYTVEVEEVGEEEPEARDADGARGNAGHLPGLLGGSSADRSICRPARRPIPRTARCAAGR